MTALSLAGTSFFWQPLFESAAQTLTGAISSYSLGKIAKRLYSAKSFDGAMDFWFRGIDGGQAQEGDRIAITGQVSPYVQLFPGNPLENATRWNALYCFSGRISNAEYQTLEFCAGSDAAIRVGSLNGESLIGIYDQYGFVGEGLVGVVSTELLKKRMPEIYNPDSTGMRALIGGKLTRCPGQHGFIVQAISQRVGLPLNVKGYNKVWYLNVEWIEPYTGRDREAFSLLGSLWAATEQKNQQYIVRYSHLTNPRERLAAASGIFQDAAWKKACVFFDDLNCPRSELSFKRLYF